MLKEGVTHGPPQTVISQFSFFAKDAIILIVCLFVRINALHHLCVWCPWRSEEGIESLETRVTDGCEPPVVAGI